MTPAFRTSADARQERGPILPMLPEQARFWRLFYERYDPTKRAPQDPRNATANGAGCGVKVV